MAQAHRLVCPTRVPAPLAHTPHPWWCSPAYFAHRLLPTVCTYWRSSLVPTGAAPRGPAARGAGGARSGGPGPVGGGGRACRGSAAGGAGRGRQRAGGAGRAADLRGVAGAAGGGPMTSGGRPQRSTRVLAGLVLAAVLSTRWVRLNVSGSLPYGLYRLAPIPHPLARGTVVLLPVPESVQHVWSPWVPLLKPVAAVAGDTVCNRDGVLQINGVAYGPMLRTAHGTHLPHMLQGCCVVQDGEVFLASHVGNSLDSRYFSWVRICDLTAKALPDITWHEAEAIPPGRRAALYHRPGTSDPGTAPR